MPRFFKVPEDRKSEQGMFIGGAYVQFKDGNVEQPDGVDWSWALPGFVEVAGPPEPMPAAEATAKAGKAKT
jgi:hypothetical protein